MLAYAVACDFKVMQDAVDGVNVIVWFSINLRTNATTHDPHIHLGINTTCIAETAAGLKSQGLETTHLISIGGWDAPHIDTTRNGTEWFAAWDRWNMAEVAHPALGFDGFDGFDWDLEGNDTPSNAANEFSVECLDAMGTMSMAAKAAGYIVTMVPPESYLDPTTAVFDRSLQHAYPEWHPEFLYHGHNCYALLQSKYGTVELPGNGRVATFDLIDIQLYESWSHAGYAIDVAGVPAADYLERWIRLVLAGWNVDFSADPSVQWPSQRITIAPEQLIVGFSFGSSGGSGKSVYISPEDAGKAWAALPPTLQPRGAMYWNMQIDGGSANGTHHNVSLAKGFNEFLKTRPVSPAPASTHAH